MAATCSYNGITFTALYRSQVHSRPVPDEAQRTIVYVEHRLTIDGYVCAQPTDATMDGLRKDLEQMGGALNYSSKGFGDLIVNGDSPVRDVKWGPVPELLSFVPLGGDANAARVKWVVVTRIPECDDARYREHLLAWCWDISHELDRDNYTTERVSGYIEIPMTRTAQTDRSPPDSVDRYREVLESTVPLGFRREGAAYHTSQDRRRLDFAWNDVELPQALPEWTSTVEARHKMSANLPFKIWTMSISAAVTVPRGVVRSHSLTILTGLIGARTAQLIREGWAIIPQSMSFEENIWGKDSSFTWIAKLIPPLVMFGIGAGPLMGQSTIGAALDTSRMWYPVGTDYARWRASLSSVRADTTRGWADLRHLPQMDLIVDLCMAGDAAGLIDSNLVASAPPDRAGTAPDNRRLDDNLQLRTRNLRPDNSWLRFEMDAQWEDDSRVIRHKLLPDVPPDDATDSANRIDVTGDFSRVRSAQGAPGSQVDGQDDDVFQRVGKPGRNLVLTGFAVRVGYRVPTPKVESIGGIEPVELSRQINERTVEALSGTPFHQSAWRIVYALPGAPTGPYPTLANPVAGTDGSNRTLEGFLTGG